MKNRLMVISSALVMGLLAGCGGSDSTSSTTTGQVSVYLTDDIGDYQQVTATVTAVQLEHTGSGATCELLGEEQVVDIANLEETLQLLGTVECEAAAYNRVHIEFAREVALMDSTGLAATCNFTSYKEHGNGQPNSLVCEAGDCSLDMTGAVNVAANQYTTFALDFDLKDFEVEDYGQADCAVTMKVSPMNSDDLAEKKRAGYREGVTGLVSDLDTALDTFTLTTRRDESFQVDYSQSTYDGTPQSGLDELLTLAAAADLKVRIMALSLDTTGVTPINATTIFVKVHGTVGDLDGTAQTFILTNSAKALVMAVDYADAYTHDRVQGILADEVWVETKLFGYADPWYLAHEVEVEDETAPDSDD